MQKKIMFVLLGVLFSSAGFAQQASTQPVPNPTGKPAPSIPDCRNTTC